MDFIWTKNEIEPSAILKIADSKDYWGQEIPEPYICIKDINLSNCNIQLLSPDKHPTIKIHLDCGVDIMKFKSSQEEYDNFTKQNTILSVICKAAKNEWMGRVTPQLIAEDYELREE